MFANLNDVVRPRFILAALAVLFAVVSALAYPARVLAEGTEQFNIEQRLSATNDLFADIKTVGETINISVCTNTSISIWNTNGTPNINGDDTALITAAAFTANLACGSALPNPITGAYKYTPASIGTYRIQFTNLQARYDFTVTANSSIDPNPTLAGGRIWSYRWGLDTGTFAESGSTNANLYILVPASVSGEHYVWKLDLNKFSGNVYSIAANSLGLDSPYSGLSATDANSDVTPEFPIYLGFPGVANVTGAITPTVTNARFEDDLGQDNIFSPNGTATIQDTGFFKFDTAVNNGNYAITIDTNQNGVFGTGDRLLLGKTVNGANSVLWDGKYPNGSPVSSGVYNARIQVRLGEYHFISTDAETSGGTTNGGATFANGLTIYQAIDAVTDANTPVYWDDLTELSGDPDATANVPGGVTSGSTADANTDNKADGFHTWGSFVNTGLGNNNNIDTYVYGPSAMASVNIAVAPDEQGDTDGVASGTELGATNFGDGNGDGTSDYLQSNVSSLPNNVGGNYNTAKAAGGTCGPLSSVAISAENQLSTSDTKYDYPVGLFNYHITCTNPGDTANIVVYYDKVYDTSVWTARKYISGAYSNIPGAVFGTATVGTTSVTTMSYSITDGSALDEDGLANGVITDPVGPGVLGAATVGAPNTGFHKQSGAMPAALILAGILVLSGALYVRRKNR